jgi:hypothetical protein
MPAKVRCQLKFDRASQVLSKFMRTTGKSIKRLTLPISNPPILNRYTGTVSKVSPANNGKKNQLISANKMIRRLLTFDIS